MDTVGFLMMSHVDSVGGLVAQALFLGYAGVYGSFLLFARRAEKRYGVPAQEILVEMARRGMVGDEEGMIEDTALNLTRSRR